MGALIAGLAIAFSYSWQLTLVTLGCLPIMIASGVVQAKLN